MPYALPKHFHSNHPARGKPGPHEQNDLGNNRASLQSVMEIRIFVGADGKVFPTWSNRNGLRLWKRTWSQFYVSEVATVRGAMVNRVHTRYELCCRFEVVCWVLA